MALISPTTGEIIINKTPFVADSYGAEPVAVHISAPSGDPFSEYEISKIVWAAELRNGSFSFSYPQPARK